MLALAALCLVTAAGVLVVLRGVPGRGGQTRPSGAPYAYTTARALVIRRGDHTIATVPRIYDAAGSGSNEVVWTGDGDYVITPSDEPFTDPTADIASLILVETHTGKQRRLPCQGCQHLASFGARNLLALDWRGSLTRFNLTGNPSSTPVPLSPTAAAGDGWVGLTGGGHSSILAETRESGDNYPKIVRPDGKKLDSTGYFSAESLWTAGSDRTIYGKRDVYAIAYNDAPGECVSIVSISLASPGLDTVSFDADASSGTAPPAPRSRRGMRIEDLWWGIDGRLRLSLTTWTCGPGDSEAAKMRLAADTTVWRLDGRTLVRDQIGLATAVRDLSDSSRLILRIPACVGGAPRSDAAVHCNVGTLYQDTSGARRKIADQVIAMSAPPPPGRPRTSSWPTPPPPAPGQYHHGE
jgi:hypothetical protein